MLNITMFLTILFCYVVVLLEVYGKAIIVGVTSAPKPDQSDTAMNPPYLVGLKNPIYAYTYVCTLIRKELSQHIIANPEFIKRRGWNALCAMFPDRVLEFVQDKDIVLHYDHGFVGCSKFSMKM
jgi:hypothetical protein